MSTTGIATDNLYAEPDLLKIFGAQGSRHTVRHWGFWSRISWWCNTYDQRDCWIYKPTSLLPMIDELFAKDAVAGQAHRVHTLRVDPYQAATLYLEGVITFEHVNAAVERDNHIDIPGVDINGHTLTVRVTQRVLPMATLDYAGTVIN
jgi:hypothetical protein